ncbi:hypothetical protein EDM80_10545 [bacterium]|nr:MAG: hypothetical protein EDM80_10545 [bacterium]RIK64061.1 MAG: hypothetical protein DCC64_04940 [Planctomycetota bacterium]
MPEKLAVTLALVAGAATLFAGLFAQWGFVTTGVATLAAMLGGMLAGRLLGGLSARTMDSGEGGTKP